MNAKAQQAKVSGSNAGDIAKLTLAGLLVVAGVFAFYWYPNVVQVVRVLGLVAVLVVAVAIAAFTELGRRTRNYLAESQFEMRKVVWPTRDETVKTTLIILGVTVLLSLILGAIDLILKTVVLDWLLNLSK